MNCTVSGNASRASSGGLQCWGASTVLILNCIVWGNSPESACGDLSYSLVDRTPLFVHEGAFDFERFVTASVGGVEQPFPDFVLDPPDYRLHSGSPAIDAGTSEGAPSSDIDGIARPVGSAVDLGALEYEGPIGELVLDDGEPGTEASGQLRSSSAS